MCRSEKGISRKTGSLLTATFSDKFTDKLEDLFAENTYY
jgi:hypothetical protein